MTGVSYPIHDSPPPGDEPDAKRRKIRKGTRSCWECKRRKIRCIFAAPTNAVCDGCKRRGTNCVSQEFPDEPTLPGAGRQVGDRLGRMEALVELLVKKAGPNGLSKEVSDLLPSDLRSDSSMSVSQSPRAGLLTPDRSDAEGPAYLSWIGHESERSLESETVSGSTQPQWKPSLQATALSSAKIGQVEKHAELSRHLIPAWPPQDDIDIIVKNMPDVSGMLHQVISMPYELLMTVKPASLKDLLQLPPMGSHPVLTARKLLILAAILQHVNPDDPEFQNLSCPPRELMHRAAETAISLVTSNDEMIGSIEGVECIMLEGVYQANAGNLRRSWLSWRRAMVIAQMMGLSRGIKSPALKILTLETRERLDPAHLWYRIVFADRAMSLMLGLPQGSLDNSFASTKELEKDTPMGRLERIQTVIQGRILQRNDQNIHDLAATQDIDQALQKASATMPSQWWLMPDMTNFTDDMSMFMETMRCLNQFMYYYLIIQLHLPYMLRFSADRKYDYSKITCVNASREVLSRFITFRSFNTVAFSCRGVDFYAFMASMTLCLAHLDSHQHRDAHNFLAHQRLSDCGMMEKVLENMQELARLNKDVLSEKSAVILTRMLAIEADAAAGAKYSTKTTDDAPMACDEEPLEPHHDEGENVLRICVPYFGTIKIAKEGLSKSDSATGSPEIPTLTNVSDPLEFSRDANSLLTCSSTDVSCRNTPASTPAGYHVGTQSANPDWEAVPSNFGGFGGPQPAPNEVFNFNSGAQNSQVLVPGLMAGADDWAFQGVDMAFFDSLFRGSAIPDVNDASAWTKWVDNESMISMMGNNMGV